MKSGCSLKKKMPFLYCYRKNLVLVTAIKVSQQQYNKRNNDGQ